MKIRILNFALLIISLISCDDVKMIYDENGNLIQQGNLSNGKKQGCWVTFNANGDTLTVDLYENGNLLLKKSYTTDGLSFEESFSQGLKNGPFKVYWPSGKIMIEGNYKNDSLDGPMIRRFESGITEAISYFKSGNPVGQYKYFYPDGSIQISADNFGNGDHHVFDSLGNKIYTVIFDQFVPVDTLEAMW